ncbi:MAG: hypothetical protein IT308_00595 [Anaerolineaceae bacterium]|nr:hypothetical protein [Anaerolineaceae bacterium]
MRKNRPFLIWVVLLMFCIIGWFGFLRAWQAFVQWDFLSGLGLRVSPLYLTGSGVVWAAAGLFPAAGIWFRRRWAFWGSRAAALLTAASYWADRLFLHTPAQDPGNLLFALGLTAVFLLYVFGVFSLPLTRGYFKMG